MKHQSAFNVPGIELFTSGNSFLQSLYDHYLNPVFPKGRFVGQIAGRTENSIFYIQDNRPTLVHDRTPGNK